MRAALLAAVAVALAGTPFSPAPVVDQGEIVEISSFLTAQLAGTTGPELRVSYFADSHLWFAGNPGWNEPGFIEQLERAKKGGSDFIWGLGDYGDNNNNQGTRDRMVALLAASLGQAPGVPPFVATIGNHESYGNPVMQKIGWYAGFYPQVDLTRVSFESNKIPFYFSFHAGDPAQGTGLLGISLDSNVIGVPSMPTEKIGPEQLKWLHDLCAANPDRKIVVAVHEPAARKSGGQLLPLLKNGQTVLRVLLQFPNVLAVLHGHIHQRQFFTLGDGTYRPPLQVVVSEIVHPSKGYGFKVTSSGIQFTAIDANGNLSPDPTPNTNFPVWPHTPGVIQYGISTSTAAGPVLMGTNQRPQSGNENFKLTCIGAPPNTTGWVLFSGAPDVAGWDFLNTKLYVGQAGLVPVAVQSDGSGYAEFALPLTGIPAGVRFHTQFLWTVNGQLPLSASHGLDVTVQ